MLRKEQSSLGARRPQFISTARRAPSEDCSLRSIVCRHQGSRESSGEDELAPCHVRARRPSSSASPFLTLEELASHLRIGGGRGDGNRQLAVVGSSGNLLGSGLGSVIDEAVVIRVTVWQVEAKTAFLESKGVDAFTIAQAACVSLADYEAFGPVQTEKYA